jgi:hypothetical protein
MSKKKNKPNYNPPISMFNWFITLLISIIPGVNILFFIFAISFAKAPSKRSFAVAARVLSLLLLAAAAILVWFFSDTIVSWLKSIAETAESAAA